MMIAASEGGLIAGIVAAETSDVTFVIALAAPAVSGLESMKETLRLYTESGTISAQAAEFHQCATRLALAKDWPALEESLYRNNLEQLQAVSQKTGKTIANMEALAREYAAQSVTTYQNPRFAFQIAFDPATAWSRVTVPVLALYAEFDHNVPAELHQLALTGALEQAGNDDVTILVMADVNHLFVEARGPSPNPAAWTEISDQLAPVVLNTILNWLQERITQS